MTKSFQPIHPGQLLYEQAMQPLGVSRNKLARDIDVPVGRISDIVAGKRGVTPDTALRLGKYFGTSAEMWMQFQTDYDLFVARNSEWKNIAPRVRELQPMDPDAVAPVTAMDEHTDRISDQPDQPNAEQSAEVEASVSEGPVPEAGAVLLPDDPTMDDVAEESAEKWWSASLSDSAVDPSDDALAVEDVDLTADQSSPHPTIRLDGKPNGGAAQTVEAVSAGVSASEQEAATTEQTFEINIHPAAAESPVVSGGDEPTDENAPPASPPRRYTVDVVREATQALRTSTDSGPATLESEPLDEDGFTIEFDEDELATELPGDAFADQLDEAASAEEEVEKQQHQVPEPVIARTGTDEFGPLDPPFAAPGLDIATRASAEFHPGTEAPTAIGGLTPANWSSALEDARRDEPSVESPEPSGPASGDAMAVPEIDGHFDVPLPPEFEPVMEGSLPPWSPQETDDPLVSLDIPDPEEARKLYEYDD